MTVFSFETITHIPRNARCTRYNKRKEERAEGKAMSNAKIEKNWNEDGSFQEEHSKKRVV
jgi:hypothetical protein